MGYEHLDAYIKWQKTGSLFLSCHPKTKAIMEITSSTAYPPYVWFSVEKIVQECLNAKATTPAIQPPPTDDTPTGSPCSPLEPTNDSGNPAKEDA